MKRFSLLLIAMVWMVHLSYSQETFPVNGVQDNRSGAIAFTNANIVVKAGNVIQNGTMLIREGKIEAVGNGLSIPSGYQTINLEGKYIYPSLIDLYTTYGLPRPERQRGGRWGGPEQIQSETKGAYNANEAIKAEYQASDEFTVDDKEAEKLRKLGFGTVLTHREDGISRGSSAMVTLGNNTDNSVMISAKTANHLSFEKGSSRQNYPSSAMGYIALLRQTYLDAQWYRAQTLKSFTDKTLDAFIANQSLPQIFDASGWMTALRADKVGDEFGVQYIIKGGGDEYQRINEVKAMNASLIIPLDFPDAYDVDDPWDAQRVSLADMKHWEMAPANPSILSKNGINFALTANRTQNFWDNLRKSIEYGLSENTALNALTVVPAQMVNMGHLVGTLEKGKLANFLITSGNLFEEKTVIHENWIQGQNYVINEMGIKNFAGQYKLEVDGEEYTFNIKGEAGKHSGEIEVNDSTTIDVGLKIDGEVISLNFKPEKESEKIIRLTGWTSENGFKGEGIKTNGTWSGWSATKIANEKEKPERNRNGGSTPELGEVIYPFMAYGSAELPKQERILIKNGTLWTNESEGILENTDLLLVGGKISKMGKNLSDQADRVIDATGKHVTPGIIDEHSHIAASAINDAATNSGMVRIGDVINSEHIGIYRALGGGVTSIQILHGSANPIGGQSALIKLRWGQNPEGLKIQGADGYIKFALGENVKRSRSDNSIRFPQTRMGVEQVYVDAFTSARDYEKKWNEYNSLPRKVKATTLAPRRDLAMETMVEILNGERFISCHSYVQSEINMLMNVAEKFGFRVNTFTHILEGYKVADKMKEHGVGASTFSDWWNYKWEVRYAIPYNATIMNREGVVTALNSDDGELMRRLNQEAGKTVKYGGTSEEEALKMVTLNPAKLLHLDNRTGSLKIGKDADVVVWSDHPLSVYSKAEQTIVDGAVYFDLAKDQAQREYIASERARLIEKMKGVKKSGGRFSRRSSATLAEFDCEDILGEETDHIK